jgi:hypothetical protein
MILFKMMILKKKNIADIPVKIDYFKAKKDIERDAGSAYSQLNDVQKLFKSYSRHDN